MKNTILLSVMAWLIVFVILNLFIEIIGRRQPWGWIASTALGILFLFLHNSSMHAWIIHLLYMLAACWIYQLSRPKSKRVPAMEGKNLEKTGVISIPQGKLQGVYSKEKRVEVFAGIPYAKPPVGDLRWKAPQEPEKWEDILQADSFAPMSMQKTHSCIFNSLYQMAGYHDWKIDFHPCLPPVSEDSLYLNIWKPAGEVSDLPVLVFIHGGYLEHGQAWYPDYSGEGLASTGRAVVVNLSYRLGIFGFFADEDLDQENGMHASGNYGLMDQIKALEWVKRNIAAFGGDPDNITIAGESSGSACVSALCTSPLAKGLFTKAIGESSAIVSKQPPHSFRIKKELLEASNKVKQQLHASSIEDLRNMPAEKLLKYTRYFHFITIDGTVLKEMPYLTYEKKENNESALLHGYNAEDIDPFMLFEKIGKKNYVSDLTTAFGKEYAGKIACMYPASGDKDAGRKARGIYTAEFFGYSHFCWSRLADQADIPVYEYFFAKKNRRLGCWHSGEEVYFYSNIPHTDQYDASDYKLESICSSYLLNFMKTGNPNEESLPAWHKTDGSRVLALNNEVKETEEQYQNLYLLFDEMYGHRRMKSIF